ncbi:MAG TPA: response regulator [Azospirillum sp.]
MALDNGHTERADTVADIEGGEETAVCREPDDFYSASARESLTRFCERFLNENALTPTELLHSPRHQTTLSNQPLFVAILQQAERILGHKPGSMNVLVNEVARLTRQRTKDWTIPDLRPDGYAAMVAEVTARNSGFDGQFIIDAAITQHIHAARTFAEKAEMLMALGNATDDADALAPIDRLLGEIVRNESGMASLAGNTPFAELVESLVTMVAGDLPLPDDGPATLRGLEALIRKAPMPVLCDGLMVAFRRELSKPDRITTASRGDLLGIETIQKEALALGVLAQRLRTGDSFFGGTRTEFALQRRMSLLVNEDTLPEIVRGRTFIQKLRILFMVQKMPLAPSSERAVNTYLKTYFDGRDFAGRLLDCWKEQLDKLRGLAEVQKLVRESKFPEDDREAIGQQIDEVQNAFIRTQRILSPLAGKEDASPEAVLDVVKLAGEGAFCAGKSRAAVARVLYRQVHRPRFVRAFLLSAASGKERASRLAWLTSALSVIGLPFADLSAMRALVVDDEEGPRNYVESVLHDLGIGAVDTAVDGQDALDRFTALEGGYDLVICDWMMPRVSGLDVLRGVRRLRPDLPFLMVTALATRKAVEKALEHHVTGYIAKPFTPDHLEDKVLLVLTQKLAPAG